MIPAALVPQRDRLSFWLKPQPAGDRTMLPGCIL